MAIRIAHVCGTCVAFWRRLKADFLAAVGCYEAAKAAYDAAQSLFQQHGRLADVATCQMHWADCLDDQGKYAEAVACYDDALPLLQQHGRPADVGKHRMHRANALNHLGKYTEALAGYDDALPLLQQHGRPAHVGLCRMNRATALSALGKYAEALAGYDDALPLLEQHGQPDEVGTCRMNRANALSKLGRDFEAVWGFNAALALLERYGDPTDVASCRMNRSQALLAEGNRAEAVADCNAALRLFQEHGRPADIALCQAIQASIWAATELPRPEEPKVVVDHNAARTLFQEHGLTAGGAPCQANSTTPLRANKALAKLVADYTRLDDSVLKGKDLQYYHSNLGRAHWFLNQREQALNHYQEARQAIRHARRCGGIDDTSLEFMAEWRDFFNEAIGCPLELGRHEEAFAAVQDAKGSILGDLRLRGNNVLMEEPADVRSSRQQLAEWLRQPSLPETIRSSEEGAVRWRGELRQRTNAYLSVWNQHRHGCRPKLPAGLAEDDPIPLKGIQTAIPAGWTLIDFWRTGNEEVTAFVVFRDAPLQVVKVAFPVEKPSFRTKLEALERSIANPLAAPNDEALDDLAAYLFAPLRRLLRERNIQGLYLVAPRLPPRPAAGVRRARPSTWATATPSPTCRRLRYCRSCRRCGSTAGCSAWPTRSAARRPRCPSPTGKARPCASGSANRPAASTPARTRPSTRPPPGPTAGWSTSPATASVSSRSPRCRTCGWPTTCSWPTTWSTAGRRCPKVRWSSSTAARRAYATGGRWTRAWG
jgi:tetratricopeptide (TPR) repeat protein